MPRVRLEIIPKPPKNKYALFIRDNGNLDPFFSSTGDWDYICGSCNHILVSGFILNQLQGNAAFQCPKCENYNLHT